jgi:hypothetical protein
LEPIPLPPEKDLEFRRPYSRDAGDSGSSYDDYQRLVANPFLGLVALGFWLLAAGYAILEVRGLPLVAALVLLFASGFFFRYLFHYHCLDCGATGLLQRYRRHSCLSVQDRYRTGRRRRLRLPNPILQFVLWIYVLVALAMLFANRF